MLCRADHGRWPYSEVPELRNPNACQVMDKSFKDRIVAAARAKVNNGEGNGGLCLPLAVAVEHELAEHGIRAVLQAGSAQWRCMDVDDGISPNYFAYMWELSAQTKQRLLETKLPEIHCWIGIPSTHEIVDISTNNLVEQARLRSGINWTAPIPPDYIWASAENFPADCHYVPDMAAISVAMFFAQRL